MFFTKLESFVNMILEKGTVIFTAEDKFNYLDGVILNHSNNRKQ